MKTYTFKREHFDDAIQVGEPVYIGDEQIVVLNILSVDFTSESVLFTGFNVNELSINKM